MFTSYTDILSRFFPDASWGGEADTYENITWYGPPVPQATLDAMFVQGEQADVVDQITAKRDLILTAPFTDANGVVWSTDPAWQAYLTNLMAFLRMGNQATTISLRDHAGVLHVMSRQDFATLYNALTYWRSAVYGFTYSLIDAVSAATTTDDVDAVNIVDGWPTTWDQVQALQTQQTGSTTNPPIITPGAGETITSVPTI